MSSIFCPKCQEELLLPEEIPSGSIVCPRCHHVQELLQEGMVLGNYRIIRFLSSGNMGNVYLAEQISVSRKVVLKVLDSTKAASQNEVEKFLKEARNTVRFNHPNIVSAIDAGLFDNVYCIAMQYMEGETLETILAKGRIYTLEEALKIILPLSDALKSIWNKNKMFHKDVKPSNIMITPDGDPMLLDMGIAQNLGESSLDGGEIEGTPLYMSPEQAKGEKLSWSTDCYSLGATLFHMVTGSPPYWDDDIRKILEKHCFAPLPNPDQAYYRITGKRIRFPDSFKRVMKKMLAKNQDCRYHSWEDFQRDMTTCLILQVELSKQTSSPRETVLAKLAESQEETCDEESSGNSRETPSGNKIFSFFAANPVYSAVGIILFLVFLFLVVFWHTGFKKDFRRAEKLLSELKTIQTFRSEMDLQRGKRLYEELQELSQVNLPVNVFYSGKIKKAAEGVFPADEKWREDEKRYSEAEKIYRDFLHTLRQHLEEADSKIHIPAGTGKESIHLELDRKIFDSPNLLQVIREEFQACKNRLSGISQDFHFPELRKKQKLLQHTLEKDLLTFNQSLADCKRAAEEERKRLQEEEKKLLQTHVTKKPKKRRKKVIFPQVDLEKASQLFQVESYRALNRLYNSFHTNFPEVFPEVLSSLTLPAALKNVPAMKKFAEQNIQKARRLEKLHKDSTIFRELLADSGKTFQGFTMRPHGSRHDAALHRIRKGELLLVRDYDNWNINMDKLTPATLTNLAIFAVNRDGNLSPYLLGFLLSIHAYDKALANIRQENHHDQEITQRLLYYFLRKEYKRNRGKATFDLNRKYKNTPEYKKVFRKTVKGKSQ